MSDELSVRLAAILLAVALAGCNSMPGKPSEAERPVRPAQMLSFDLLYGTHCAGCHGENGRFGAARPLNDPVYLALVSDDQLYRIIAAGVPGTSKPAFADRHGGGLTEVQIRTLIRGMRARWARPDELAGAVLPPYSEAESVATGLVPGDPHRGAAVYETYCAQCHGPEGRGSTRGGSVVQSAYLALVSDQALRSSVIAGRIDLGMPDWREYVPGRPMRAQEISDVVAWMASFRPPAASVRGK